MRKLIKIGHTIGSCGHLGALAGVLILLALAVPSNAAEYAATRRAIEGLCTYLLVPSLGLVLLTGLVSMAVHRPFQEQRWVWLKALLGISMFEGSLGIQSKATYAADLSAKIAAGAAPAEALSTDLPSEWGLLTVITVLALANVVLGVWRPRLKWRGAAS